MDYLRQTCIFFLTLSIGGTGCTTSQTPIGPSTDEIEWYESSKPGLRDYRGGDDETTGEDTSAPPDEQPERDIEEADIIKLDDNRLYALSPFGGLAVLDISAADDLKLMGRFKTVATPFEMYVRENVALVLYNGYGEYTYDDANEVWDWHQTSYVVAVDVADPRQPREIARFNVPGYISDSRIVGQVLYVVSFEDGYCWNCNHGPRTNVVSIDVSDTAALRRVGELSFEELEGTYSWQRSVMATDERLYVAGPTWGDGRPVGSTIQVIDISDPDGQMQQGASVEVSGQIQNRWQMDEFEGVLRVVSQPFLWWEEVTPPRVETFEVMSASMLTPLGSTALVIPANESLRSVRFDGQRAYAITAEQMDPLFTLDLSDPSAPRQVGELDMPGWVYHMEPRGERMLGLGYDQGNPDGSLTVSLFDVNDLSTPTLLDRVNFGGDWGSLAEDQDRIHKSFNVLAEIGLVLVPFSGWSYEPGEANACPSQSYLSGVQLVDWSDDVLRLRGVAELVGLARRGTVVQGNLLAMSDERVATFSLSDRDAPARLDQAVLAERVEQVAANGEFVARVGHDWVTNTTQVTISSMDHTDDTDYGALFELSGNSANGCNGYSYLSHVIATDDRVYLQYQESHWDDEGRKGESARIMTLDVSDAEHPLLAGDVELDFAPNYNGFSYSMPESGESVLALGDALVLHNHKLDWNSQTGELIADQREVKFIDLKDPAKPSIATLSMPTALGATGLVRSGNILATSHFVASPNDILRVRFYLDRLDVTHPTEPKLLPSVNIPGSLLAYDAPSQHALSLDYREVTEQSTAKDCYEELNGAFVPPDGGYEYEHTLGLCTLVEQTLNLISVENEQAEILDSHTFEWGENVGLTRVGDDRLFVAFSNNTFAVDEAVDDAVTSGDLEFESAKAPLMVFGGLDTDRLQVGRIDVTTGDRYYGGFNQLAVKGHLAVVSTGFRGRLSVIDAENVHEPRLVREIEVPGWVQDLDIVGNEAIAALGYDGVEVISLED